MKKPKIIVIVGPTASGKTTLSIKLAKLYNGEIVSADSRQVYRGLDLGSGKVTIAEMDGIAHHLLDVADPETVYTVHDYKEAATAVISDIIKRHCLPIVVGGTFLYTDTLLGRISPAPVPPNPALRTLLEKKSTNELLAELTVLDRAYATRVDQHNRRRLIRAIEIASTIGHVPPASTSAPYHSLTLGIDIEQSDLFHNIHVRLLERLEQGMVAEVERLIAAGVTHERLEEFGLEYRYLSRYLRGLLTYDEMSHEIEMKSRQFAKRQLTWLKRDQSICWVQPTDLTSIKLQVDSFLADE